MAGAATLAFSGILVRLADVTPSTAAVYRCLYALPVLAVLAALERRRYGRRASGQQRLAWLAGLLFAVDLVAWHHCIAAVGAGLGTVLGNVQVVLVPLAAWFVLSERPAWRVLALVSSGVVLISGVVGAGAYGDEPVLGVVFGLLTAVSYAGFLLVLRAGNQDVRRPAGRCWTPPRRPRPARWYWARRSGSSSSPRVGRSTPGWSRSLSRRRCSAGC